MYIVIKNIEAYVDKYRRQGQEIEKVEIDLSEETNDFVKVFHKSCEKYLDKSCKDCSKCKYEKLDFFSEPCHSCGPYRNYESEDFKEVTQRMMGEWEATGKDVLEFMNRRVRKV